MAFNYREWLADLNWICQYLKWYEPKSGMFKVSKRIERGSSKMNKNKINIDTVSEDLIKMLK